MGTEDPSDLEYVGFWPRMWATLIDLIVVFAVTVPLTALVYGHRYWSDPRLVKGPLDFLINYLGPFLLWIWLWRGYQASPGKMAIGARIVDARSGEPMTGAQCVIRYFAYLPAAIPFLLGFIWIAIDARRQGWHDKLAGTVVIRSKNREPTPVRFDRNRL